MVETAAMSEFPAHDTPPPADEKKPQEEQPAAPAAVEPLLGLDEFCLTANVSVPAKAALRRWMLIRGQDPNGHYQLASWQNYLTLTLGHK
jgi:hypothetical protein